MVNELISKYTGKPIGTIQDFVSHDPADIYELAEYSGLIAEIDVDALKATMQGTRDHLDKALPPLVDIYKKKYDLTEFPLTGYMICNWVVGYLNFPQYAPDLLKKHVTVSRPIMREVLPEVLDALGGVPKENKLWQKAFSTMVIPLIAQD